MYVSLLMVALTTTPAAEAERGVRWEDSYNAAKREAREQNKPLAVFLGNGADGWQGVVAGGTLSPQAREVLNRDYVPVYADESRPAGRRLAEALEVSGPALVLSSRGGENQAFRHEGELPAADLERTLTKFATPDLQLTSTQVLGSTETRNYFAPSTREMKAPATVTNPGTSGVVYAGAYSVAPVTYSAGYYAPASSGYGVGCSAPVSYGCSVGCYSAGSCGYSQGCGSCGGGRCGGRRCR